MTITSETLYDEAFEQAEKVLTPESVAELKGAAEKHYGFCHTLTLDQFWGCAAGDYELLGDMTQPKVLQVYWLKRFEDFCEEFAKACEQLNIKDENSDTIQSGCVKMSPQESMLVFVRNYFGLPSFAEAGKRTIGEYMLARKDNFNTYRMHKNREAIQMRKLKKK